MAIYTFGSSATNTGLSTVQTLTSNPTQSPADRPGFLPVAIRAAVTCSQ